MNTVNENRKKWLTYLRTPGLKKAIGRLGAPDGSRCCLGHACDAFGARYTEGKIVHFSMGDDLWESHFLPDQIARMLNVTREGHFRVETKIPNGEICRSLADVNDFSSFNMAQIANIIEEVAEKDILLPYSTEEQNHADPT